MKFFQLILLMLVNLSQRTQLFAVFFFFHFQFFFCFIKCVCWRVDVMHIVLMISSNVYTLFGVNRKKIRKFNCRYKMRLGREKIRFFLVSLRYFLVGSSHEDSLQYLHCLPYFWAFFTVYTFSISINLLDCLILPDLTSQLCESLKRNSFVVCIRSSTLKGAKDQFSSPKITQFI